MALVKVSFNGTVQPPFRDRPAVIVPDDWAAYNSLLANAAWAGLHVTVTIEPVQLGGDALRGYFFAVVVPEFMKKTGHTKDETKNALRDRYFGEGSSLSSRTAEEWRDFCEWCRAEGASMQITIPLPNEGTTKEGV